MIGIDPVKTGKNIKKYRKEKGLTVKEVTKNLGLRANQSIYKWERGDCLPRIDNFLTLCCLYDVSPVDLLGFYDQEQAEHFRNLLSMYDKPN